MLNVLPEFTGYVAVEIPENLRINRKDNAIKDLEEIANNFGVGNRAKVVVGEESIYNEIYTIAEDT